MGETNLEYCLITISFKITNDMRINPKVHNTIDSIAGVYKMHPSTLSKFLKPQNIIDKDESRVLKQKTVLEIVEFLGSPELIDGEFDPLEYCTNTKFAEYYRINYRTFLKWLKPIQGLKAENKSRRRYFPKEVKLIVEHLGT